MTIRPVNRFPRNGGFALVSAIFIVVVLALLAIMMVTIGGTQRATASAAVQGARAYHAARTGVEWAIFQAITNNSCVATTPLGPPTAPTFTPAVDGLHGFSVWVDCTSTEHREGPPPNNFVYVITAFASSGNFGQAEYVSRRIQVTVTNAPTP